jgi:hypothetical protein
VNVQQGLTGKFVLVRYEEQPFVGQVHQVFDEELEVSCISALVVEQRRLVGEMTPALRHLTFRCIVNGILPPRGQRWTLHFTLCCS